MVDFPPFLHMLRKCEAREKPTFHSNISTIHITIAVAQIKSQMTKPHGAWIGHIINDFMILLIVLGPSFSSKNSLHAMRHALHQCHQPSHSNCAPRLAESLMQIWPDLKENDLCLGPDGYLVSGSIGFVSGPITVKSMISTQSWSRNSTMPCATCGRTLSCTNTKFHLNTPLSHVSLWSLTIGV